MNLLTTLTSLISHLPVSLHTLMVSTLYHQVATMTRRQVQEHRIQHFGWQQVIRIVKRQRHLLRLLHRRQSIQSRQLKFQCHLLASATTSPPDPVSTDAPVSVPDETSPTSSDTAPVTTSTDGINALPPSGNDDSTPSPRTPDPTFRLATGDLVNSSTVLSTDVPGSSSSAGISISPSTDIPFVTITEAPVLIPDVSTDSPATNGVPASTAPITPDDIMSPVPIAVTKTPTMVPVTSTTPDSAVTMPTSVTPAPKTLEASFYIATDGLATSPPTSVPSAGTGSASTSGFAVVSHSTTSSSSSAPQPTFHDATSGVTSTSGETTNTSHSVSSSGTSLSKDEQESSTTKAPITSNTGSFSETSVGDASTDGSIEFSSSSTEIPNEISSDDGSQAISSKANSGNLLSSVVTLEMKIVVSVLVFTITIAHAQDSSTTATLDSSSWFNDGHGVSQTQQFRDRFKTESSLLPTLPPPTLPPPTIAPTSSSGSSEDSVGVSSSNSEASTSASGSNSETHSNTSSDEGYSIDRSSSNDTIVVSSDSGSGMFMNEDTSASANSEASSGGISTRPIAFFTSVTMATIVVSALTLS